MPTILAASLTATTLSAPLKDLYESGKHQFKDKLSKWNNARNIKVLSNKVATYEQVKTIWQREKKVKLSNFYYPSKVIFETGNTKLVLSLRDLPCTGGLVIQGTVGQGKSIFLRYLCIQELSIHSSQRVPVFFELRKLDANVSLEKALMDTLACLGFDINDELFEYYAESGKLVIMLDGFDELEESIVNDVVRSLEGWAIKYPKLQFIISCRPGGEIQKSNHFSVVRLAPLSSEDIKPFMAKIGVKGTTLDNLYKAVEASPNEIRGLLNTPLLLTLLVLVYQSEGIIPNELPEFFKLLFTTVFVKHDRTKPAFNRKLKSGLNDQRLERFFEAFCYAVLRRKYTVNLKQEQLKISHEDAIKFSGDSCTLEGFKHDIEKVACLLQEDGLYISFVHKSLLDYYPAAFVKSCTDEQSLRIYNAITPHWRQWRHVLGFLEYIDKYRFVKYFAIPTYEKYFSIFGVVNGRITDANVRSLIDNAFDSQTVFSFAYQDDSKTYVQRGFGPYHPVESFFFDLTRNVMQSIHRMRVLPKLECAYTETIEDTEKRFEVHWKVLLSADEIKNIERITKDFLNSLLSEFAVYNSYIAEESRKADLLAQFDVS